MTIELFREPRLCRPVGRLVAPPGPSC